ncbi:uncharacterized protein SPAPADRAFT_58868 [Spathaspora passalidarum NRRL Y-27907]|uniref:Uncharacterized protein n=1 Tax=Spathaspora passalidarum (strain NRRL Y-27907 / 11-Y1) TaxID=619300 RepID=G3AEN5_SPAPN|nr:uncharacterized protein SPAPADRAFT_58868 [Spathaspora passalidarum NRRL Y-27907]EGW35661.1 hypothetical protein SPAPADRAFT_58868 [Spathaspora passalidarum NRRL Y-27907]
MGIDSYALGVRSFPLFDNMMVTFSDGYTKGYLMAGKTGTIQPLVSCSKSIES